MLNKRGGPFAAIDIRRLKAFCAQIAIAIHNAQLFSDVLALKNYNESILKSLSNGVVTLDQRLNVAKVNEAGERILGMAADDVLGRPAEQVFGNRNAWVTRSLEYVVAHEHHRLPRRHRAAHAGRHHRRGQPAPRRRCWTSTNKAIGYMLVLEDITREKRVRNTMSRYMAKEVVDRLLASGDEMLKGSSHVATVLFSDIRQFTTLTEAMSPQQTVAMLNEYFTEMVEVVLTHGGMLDKYIGDALMAIFGAPVEDVTDADRALTVATEMIRELEKLNLRRVAERPGRHRYRHRARHRRGAGRLGRLGQAHGIHRDRRHREPRGAPRKRQQALRHQSAGLGPDGRGADHAARCCAASTCSR